ncbi:MAG: hypothetical protein DLM58_19670 [Pseudonocardiales bacterium]|nr:MAG: hypothetical protein DLM58_19670 [Pseudonocardiales bacterium]
MAGELLARLAGDGPAVLASVADSDVCVVTGWVGGQRRWRWVYGEAMAGDGDPEQLEASFPDRVRATAAEITDWVHAADLPVVDGDGLVEALEAGDVFAEESLQRLLVVLGVATPDHSEPDGQPSPSPLGQPTGEHPIAAGALGEVRGEVKAAAIDHTSVGWRQLVLDHDLYEFGEPPAMVSYAGMVFLASDPPVTAIGHYAIPVEEFGVRLGATGPWIDVPAEHTADLAAAAAWARAHVGRAGASPWPTRPPLNIEVGLAQATPDPAKLTAHLYSVAPPVSYQMELVTYVDLETRWDALASWLDGVRHALLEPIAAAYADRGGSVEYGWNWPWTPYSLGVWSALHSSTGRRSTAKADTPSWSRLLSRVRRGELSGVSLDARVMNGDGAWGDRWGSFTVGAWGRPGGTDSATVIRLAVSEPLFNLIDGEQPVTALLDLTRVAATDFDIATGYVDVGRWPYENFPDHWPSDTLRLDTVTSGPAWILILGPKHLGRVGGRDTVARTAAFPIIEELPAQSGPLTWLQASAHAQEFDEAKRTAVAATLTPGMPRSH